MDTGRATAVQAGRKKSSAKAVGRPRNAAVGEASTVDSVPAIAALPSHFLCARQRVGAGIRFTPLSVTQEELIHLVADRIIPMPSGPFARAQRIAHL